MRSTCVIAVFMSILTGCSHNSSNSSGSASSRVRSSDSPSSVISRRIPVELTPSAELKAAVEKLHGEVRTDDRDPARPRLEIRLEDCSDSDLLALRPHLQSATDPILLHVHRADGITDAGIVHLAGIDSIRKLVLERCQITDAGFEPLATLTKLDGLYFNDDLMTDAGLAQIGKLKQLRELHIFCKGLTDDGLAHLEGLSELEDFHAGEIGQQTGDVRLSHMKNMTKLRSLSIGKDKLSDAGMAYVKNFTELRELTIEGPHVSPVGFANLAPLTKLEKLGFLACPGFNGEGAAALTNMTKLRELLVVYSGDLNLQATTHLGKLSHLKKLRLGDVEGGALKGIKDLTGLEALDLSYAGIHDADLEPLAGLTGLKELELQNTKVTSAGLKHLSSLKTLTDLNLCEDAISDDGLKHLSSLANLENLSLTDAKGVTGAGLKHLAGLTKLQRLRLNGTSVTDEGLAHLKTLRTLILVELTGTKVSDDAALELKRALPNALIEDAAGQDVSLKDKEAEPRRKVEDLIKVPPDFSMTAEKFVAEYKENRPAADQKYKGKVVQLTGTVRFFSENSYGPIVSLTAGKEAFGAVCFTANEEPWALAVPGQEVKLKGRMTPSGFGDEPLLMDCVLVDPAPTQAIGTTAEALAQEHATDPEAAAKKYHEKYLIVSGEIESKDVNGFGRVTIVLKGDGKTAISCLIDAVADPTARKLKVGQKLKMYGQYSGMGTGTDKAVKLNSCRPIKAR